jgi:hypothetical protein
VRVKKLKKKVAMEIALVILFVVVAAFSGCIEEEVKVIPISGMNQDIIISSEVPVELIVSGMGNVVTIPYDVNVMEIVMSGRDNTVYLPHSAKPQVEISGMRNEVVRYETSPLPEQPIVRPTQPTISMPATQNINGNYKVQEVSGDTINLNGNYNEIKILNADVSLIRVNGNYNAVYYPKEARPTIKENGSGNEIKTY